MACVGDRVRIRATRWLIPGCWRNPSHWTGTVVRVENTGVEVRPDATHQFRVIQKSATFTTLWVQPDDLDLMQECAPCPDSPASCAAT